MAEAGRWSATKRNSLNSNFEEKIKELEELIADLKGKLLQAELENSEAQKRAKEFEQRAECASEQMGKMFELESQATKAEQIAADAAERLAGSLERAAKAEKLLADVTEKLRQADLKTLEAQERASGAMEKILELESQSTVAEKVAADATERLAEISERAARVEKLLAEANEKTEAAMKNAMERSRLSKNRESSRKRLLEAEKRIQETKKREQTSVSCVKRSSPYEYSPHPGSDWREEFSNQIKTMKKLRNQIYDNAKQQQGHRDKWNFRNGPNWPNQRDYWQGGRGGYSLSH